MGRKEKNGVRNVRYFRQIGGYKESEGSAKGDDCCLAVITLLQRQGGNDPV